MDVDRHQVSVNNASISLPLKEFELLEFLMRNSGRVLTRMQLIDRVWGSDYVGDTKTLDVHIKRLRAKIEADPANPIFIQTVRGLVTTPAVLKKKESSTVLPAFTPRPGITALAFAESPSKIIGVFSEITLDSLVSVASTLFAEIPSSESGVEFALIM
eukprot:gene38604-62142_t